MSNELPPGEMKMTSIQDSAIATSEARFDAEKTFDATAYAKEVMRTVGADFHEDDPLFQTNEFRMHCYKILPCTKHFCHDWSVCPFAHFSERAKRRDPKDVKYTAIACPDMKKGENCPRGDRCPYSHNTFEYWLHPTRYRTRLCRDSEACNRKICFFAHKPEEVRVPSSRPSLPVAEELWTSDEFGVKTSKDTQSLDVLANSATNNVLNSISTANDTMKLDQMSQIQAILQNANLNVNIAAAAAAAAAAATTTSTPKGEATTFVDQVLNGFPPTSSCAIPELTMLSTNTPTSHQQQQQNRPQIAQIAQNLSYNSCFQAPGLVQEADFDTFFHHTQHHPINNCNDGQNNITSCTSLPPISGSISHDPMQDFGLSSIGSSSCSNPSTQQFSFEMQRDPFALTNTLMQNNPVPFANMGQGSQQQLEIPSWSQYGCDSLPTAACTKASDQYTEVLRLLSTLQMANSPTSVLATGHSGGGGALSHHQAVSTDGSSSISGNSGIGYNDVEIEKAQIGNLTSTTPMANNPAPMLTNHGSPTYYGMMF